MAPRTASASCFVVFLAVASIASVASGCAAPTKPSEPPRLAAPTEIPVASSSISPPTASPPPVRTPRCVLRSETSEPVAMKVRVGAAAFALVVSGDVEVSILDGAKVTVRAEKNGLVFEGDTDLAEVSFHRKTDRRNAWVEPTFLQAASFDDGVVTGSFSLRPDVSVELDAIHALRRQAVPCAEAAFGFIPRARKHLPGTERATLRPKQTVAFRETADGAPVARISVPNQRVDVDVLERKAGRVRVRWLHDGAGTDPQSGAFLEGWVDATALTTASKPDTDEPGAIGLGASASPSTARLDVHSCIRALPLSVDASDGLLAVGRAKPGTPIAFGAASGTNRVVVAAGSPRAADDFSPMLLAPGATLVATPKAIADAQCTKTGGRARSP